jgi:uncharacterized membrane protein YuzA (DUF378 family)
MQIEWQTVCALAIVGFATVYLVRSFFSVTDHQRAGCGSCQKCLHQSAKSFYELR